MRFGSRFGQGFFPFAAIGNDKFAIFESVL
jgi:hypothetical protein